MLVASLVRVAMENMREGSNVTIRVGPSKGESWKQYFATFPAELAWQWLKMLH